MTITQVNGIGRSYVVVRFFGFYEYSAISIETKITTEVTIKSNTFSAYKKFSQIFFMLPFGGCFFCFLFEIILSFINFLHQFRAVFFFTILRKPTKPYGFSKLQRVSNIFF